MPRALEAVRLKALAKGPQDRYVSAGELGQEVKRWLADEPVSAWREPWRLRAGRWARRHPTRVAAAAAALLVAVLAGGIGAWWLQRQRAEQQEEAARQEGALRPQAVAVYNDLGLALYDKGPLGEAVGYYGQALRLDPKLAQAHGALGRALLALGRWVEARDATRRCLDLPQRQRSGRSCGWTWGPC